MATRELDLPHGDCVVSPFTCALVPAPLWLQALVPASRWGGVRLTFEGAV